MAERTVREVYEEMDYPKQRALQWVLGAIAEAKDPVTLRSIKSVLKDMSDEELEVLFFMIKESLKL